jgi:hypothetical protein
MSILRSVCAAIVFAPLSLAQILPNDGIVGGFDSTAGTYRLYTYPALGTATPGAPTAITYDPALAQRLARFVIDKANANIIATATSASGGDVEVWRLDVTGSSATATQLTTLGGTAGYAVFGMHRDASGCIVVLCAPNSNNPAFTVHRLAVTRESAMAVQVPIANPNADVMRGIATDPSGQLLLGGKSAPYGSAAPGVLHTISMAGGTLGAGAPITGFHVASLATNSVGVAAIGLNPQSLPATATFQCGGLQYNFQYNTPPFTSIWLDVELNPAGTQFVLAGIGGGAGGPGVLIRCGAVGCVAGAPSAPVFFPHGLNQVAIAFPSQHYGCGCPPSTNLLPTINENTPPTIGQVWMTTLTNGVPNATAMLISGRTDRFYLGAPLPQSLSVIGGQTDCFLLNSGQFQFPLVNTTAAGAAQQGRMIPNDPLLIGTRLFSQWLVFEQAGGIPAFSTGGLASVVQ